MPLRQVVAAGEPFELRAYVDDLELAPESLALQVQSALSTSVQANVAEPRLRTVTGVAPTTLGQEVVLTLTAREGLFGEAGEPTEVTLVVDHFATSALVGNLVINEVFFMDITGNQNLDEAIELRNIGNEALDLSGFRLVDRHPVVDPPEPAFGMDWLIPSTDLDGNTSVLQPGEVALVTLANPQDYPLAQTNWDSAAALNYAVFPPGSSGRNAEGLKQDEALVDNGDGVWLFDDSGSLLHYVSWLDDEFPGEDGGEAPIPEHGVWDNLQQADLARMDEGTSLALATNGYGAFLAECWEATDTGDAADGDCLFGGEQTRNDDPDTSGLVTKVTSLGAPNVSSVIGPENVRFGVDLLTNEFIDSADQAFRLILRSNGNLVVEDSDGAIVWSTGTDGSNADRLAVGEDGDLSLFAGDDRVWSANTFERGGSELVVMNDGNLVLIDGAYVVWQTGVPAD